MGLFDEVAIPCSVCGDSFVQQSKGSDEAYLRHFTFAEAPDDVKSDLPYRSPMTCPRCGTRWRVRATYTLERAD